METIFRKVLVLQNGLSHARLPISFPKTILWLSPNIEQKRITLNNNEFLVQKFRSCQKFVK